MKLRGRIRSAIKWSSAAATVLLLIVWVGSKWYGVSGTYRGVVYHVFQGSISIAWQTPSPAHPSSTHPAIIANRNGYPLRFHWGFKWDSFENSAGPTAIFMGIPIWALILLTGLPTFLIWRGDRKRRRWELANRCRKCGYSRTGLPGAHVCPECGFQWF